LVRRATLVAAAALLSACAGYSGSDLEPGRSTLPEVVASMGEPALRWEDPDGRVQLAFPRGPMGTETFMAHIAADGRLERIEAVLDAEHFARIEAGRSDQAAVLRVLGPPQAQLSVHFARGDELVWKWRFCDVFSRQALFAVAFDVRTTLVRSTYQVPDYRFPGGEVPGCGQTRR
jgi:hypothetical protein